MLTNNKKSYFVKGIAMLMAMLMVLSVCLTGCGKKAEEAIQKAEAAQGSADEAKTAADAVKAMLADYLKAADGATKAEIEALIDDALADFETAKELSSFVKSDKFDELKTKVDSLLTADAVNAAINALKDSKADKSELTAIDNALQALIAAKADIATTATKAEVEALEDALTKMIDAKQTAINGILSTLEGKASNDALAAAKTELTNLINAKATVADITEALKPYVKSTDFEALEKSVADNTADMADALDNLSADVRALVEGMTSVKGDVNDLKGKVTALEDGMTEAWKSINEISANVPGLLAALNDLTTKVAGMEDALDLLSTDVRNLTVGLNDLKGKVAALEAVDLDKTITDALAAYATKGEVVENIYEILKGFYDTDAEGALIGADGKPLQIDMANMSAEMIAGLLKNSPLWSEVEWNLTTKEVIAIIADYKTLLDKLYDIDSVYTSERKGIINNLLAKWSIVIFEDGKLVDRDTKDGVLGVDDKLLYTLLRTPNRKGYKELAQAILDAKAVPTFKEELNAILETVYDIGHEKEDKNGNVYHVVTYNPEQIAAFNKFSNDLDALVARYVADKAFAEHTSEVLYNELNKLEVNYYNPETGLMTRNTSGVPTLWTTDVDLSKKDVTLASLRTEKIGDQTIVKLTNNIYGMQWDTVDEMGQTGEVALVDYAAGYNTYVALNNAADHEAATYNAYYNQFKNHKAVIDNANAEFDAFLILTIMKNGVLEDHTILSKEKNFADRIAANNAANLTEDEEKDLYDALTVYMSDKGWDDGSGVTYTFDKYLDHDVTPAMDKAEAFNDCGTTEHYEFAHALLEKYDLYIEMLSKNWMLKFNQYKGQAAMLLNDMYNDYVSVSKNAVLTAATYTDPKQTKFTPDASVIVTPTFLDAFLNGADFTGWNYGKLSYGKDFADTNLLYFYGENNGAAGTDYVANPLQTMADYIKAYQTASGSKENIIAYDLQKAQLPARLALEELVKNTTAPVAGKQPEELFAPIFAQAVDALDEVYERYLLEDYKITKINEIFAITDDIADRYSIYDGATDTVLITAMQDYLISTTEGNVAPYDIEELKNGALLAELAPYYVEDLGVLKEMPDFSKDVTASYGAVKQIVEDAKLVLWEMAIMDNFESYLLHASTYLDAAYKAYTSIDKLDASRVYKLHVVYTEQAEKIAEYDRQDYIDGHEFAGDGENGYIKAYYTLLSVVATEDLNNHLEDLLGNTYAEELAGIKSAGEDAADYDQTSIYRLYQPAAYEYVGGAVRAFDEQVNEYAMDKAGTRLY